MIRKLSVDEIESAISKIEYLGYAVIPGVLSKDGTRQLLVKVEALFRSGIPIGENTGVSSNQLNDKYVYNLQYKDLDFLSILTAENLLELLRPFLNDPYYTQLAPDQVNFLLAYYNARSSVDPLKLHIDNYIPTGGYHPNSMQIVFSLNGQNAQNGATTIVPGSHNIHKYPDRKAKGIEQVLECDPGDVIVWDSRLWHGALENVTRADRWSLVATFRPWWAKQNFDPVRGLSEAMFSRLSPKQKALLGFLSLPPKDESEKVSLKQEELDTFYRDIYYGEGVTTTYHASYSEYEIKQKRLRADCVVELLAQNCSKNKPLDFLEVGCGEGFVLSSAEAKGWNVLGVDYQSAPVQAFNPDVISRVVAADPNAYLSDLIEKGVRKDILVLQNVLEHVLKPEDLLRKLQQLLSDDGSLLVQVPNDFSDLQALASQQGRIDRDYWFLPPQHLNYFNGENLVNVVKSCGFDIVDGVSDFPIEMYLWGSAENYVTDKTKGKFAHQARVSLDLFFSRNGLDKYLQFYRAAFQIGVGRNICAVLKKLPLGGRAEVCNARGT